MDQLRQVLKKPERFIRSGDLAESVVEHLLRERNCNYVHSFQIKVLRSYNYIEADFIIFGARELVIVEVKNWRGLVKGSAQAKSIRRLGPDNDESKMTFKKRSSRNPSVQLRRLENNLLFNFVKDNSTGLCLKKYAVFPFAEETDVQDRCEGIEYLTFSELNAKIDQLESPKLTADVRKVWWRIRISHAMNRSQEKIRSFRKMRKRLRNYYNQFTWHLIRKRFVVKN